MKIHTNLLQIVTKALISERVLNALEKGFTFSPFKTTIASERDLRLKALLSSCSLENSDDQEIGIVVYPGGSSEGTRMIFFQNLTVEISDEFRQCVVRLPLRPVAVTTSSAWLVENMLDPYKSLFREAQSVVNAADYIDETREATDLETALLMFYSGN